MLVTYNISQNFCANLKSPKLNFKPEDFYIKIEGYGNNNQWAKEIIENADTAVDMFRTKEETEDVLRYIATSTRVAERGFEDTHKKNNTGILRTERNWWHYRECDVFTPYDGKKYANYADRFDKVSREPLKDPYNRRLSMTRPSNLFSAKLFHGMSENINFALDYVFKLSKNIVPKYIIQDVKPQNLQEINETMAEIRWILAHSTPWIRGSDAISNIFMRAMYKAIGVKTYPIKKDVSLDLEAYCTNIDEYKKLFPSYFDKAPEIIE